MSTNKKCPEVRFKDNCEKWQFETLSEMVKPISSYSLSRDVETKDDTGYRYIHYGDIHRGRISVIRSESELPNIKKGDFQFLQKGDLVVADVSEDYIGIANACVIDCEINDSIVAGLHTIAFRPVKLDSKFTYYMLHTKSFKDYGRVIGTGTKVFGITAKNFYNFEYAFPTVLEQINIGNFFQNLDQSITLHEKKLAQTQNLKKAMLEKMFPKAGSKQPEIRLKGFSGDWGVINLGSLCQIGDIDHRMPESAKSGIPYLMTGDFFGINGLDFENAKFISNEDYEHLAKKIKPEIGDILFARYASVGTVRLVVTNIKFLISYSCAILKTSVNSIGEYLFFGFQTNFAQNQIEQEINTGSQRNIGIDSLKKLSINLPKENEQKAIGQFFKQLDETLVLQQQQLQTLKNLKQAFLEKMFV
ncbi:restriction endonuclease subunit S [Acinetobacter ursingii]|uniref:restriction endonuclease subunit S n=1 Tax=Acinetobacter ursingii TaxID=108980 RepID=UPI0021CD7DD0|nr:restriction endonuclease subunit S [Acinetobacter ursingii]MCU4481811.1 restriction endonuclease subunit S [Acinetobacter ursingii]MCU4506292.1 restriction endonuclease subunit S [Acinetobacter ursingii]MCU4571551.1 restriction endonuclease subunit S [Acinetobacter ursingii]